jgi:hypothetical protein
LASADVFCVLRFVAFGLLYGFDFVIFDSCAMKALVVSHIGFMNKVLIQSPSWTLV